MDAWIDTYHAVRRLTRQRHVRVSDRQRRRLAGRGQPPAPRHESRRPMSSRERIVPFLTSKHTLELLPARTRNVRGSTGFRRSSCSAATRRVGPPRCVEHAWELREAIRERQPDLRLGGWANPHADAGAQVDFLLDEHAHRGVLPDADRVAPRSRRRSRRFVGEASDAACRAARAVRRLLLPQREPADARGTPRVPAGAGRRAARGVRAPARRRTKSARAQCARCCDLGVRRFYISNLPLDTPQRTLGQILERAGVTARA